MGLQQLGDRLVRFVGGKTGIWRVLAIRLVQGDGLPQAERVAVCPGEEPLAARTPMDIIRRHQQHPIC